MTRTKSTAKLLRHKRVQGGILEEPELVANGNTAVTAFIEQLLGLLALGRPVDVEHLETVLKVSKAVRATAHQQRGALQNEKATAEQARNALRDASSEVEQLASAYDEAKLNTLLRDHAEASSEHRAAGEQLAVLGARLNDMKSLVEGATCPTCNSKLTEHDPAKLAEEIRSIEGSIAYNRGLKEGSTRRISELDKDISAQRTAQTRLQQAQQRAERAQSVVNGLRDGIDEELAAADAALEQAETDLATRRSALANAEETNERYEAAARRSRKAESEVELAEDLISDLEASQLLRPTDVEIDTAAQAEAAYREAERAHERRKSEANSAVVLTRAEARRAKSEADYAAAELKRLEESAAKGQAARELMDKAGRLARFLRDRRQSYLQEIWQTVMGAASRQVATASRGMISEISNEGGEFTYKEDGVLAPVASASGAQKAFIGSAVRIGLARALYGADSLLIFDEPTEAMREHNASGLVASLTCAARQTLLITHREQDQGLAANIITVGA